MKGLTDGRTNEAFGNRDWKPVLETGTGQKIFVNTESSMSDLSRKRRILLPASLSRRGTLHGRKSLHLAAPFALTLFTWEMDGSGHTHLPQTTVGIRNFLRVHEL